MRPRRRFENCRTTIATVAVMYLFILQSRYFAADGGFLRVLAGLIAPKFAEIRTYLCGIDLQCDGIGRL